MPLVLIGMCLEEGMLSTSKPSTKGGVEQEHKTGLDAIEYLQQKKLTGGKEGG